MARSGLHGVGPSASGLGRRFEVDEGSLYWNWCRRQSCLHLGMLVLSQCTRMPLEGAAGIETA